MPSCLTMCTAGTLEADMAFKIIFKKIYIKKLPPLQFSLKKSHVMEKQNQT